MREQAALKETINNHLIEVFYDDLSPTDFIDPSTFDSEGSLQAYLDKFRNGFLSLFCVVVRKPCTCCNQPTEVMDSLGAIEAESPEEALEVYLSIYAHECLGPITIANQIKEN